MTKDEIRQKFLEVRNKLTLQEVGEKSKTIISALKNLEVFKKAKNILIYVSMGKEVDTISLVKELLEKNEKKILVPFMDKNLRLDIARIKRFTDLNIGRYGFLEPHLSFRVKKYKKIDIIIIPGIVFDRLGNRIGRGGGHFDTLLYRYKTECDKYERETRIALAYSCQIIDKLNIIQPHDEKVDIIITENEVIKI